MSEEVRAQVFHPFFTTKEVGQGTGQGLAIAHSVITKHKGSIAVESTPGRGTCFTIRLPLAAQAVGKAGDSPADSAAAA
jgi:signal transduction histidine kinase